MKIKPVILCGGAGVRLWPKSKKNIPKQFIDFGGWTLIEKTLKRIKNPLFDYPILSTNLMYKNKVKFFLKKNNFKKYKIILEPLKKNTAAAILSSTLSHLYRDINIAEKNSNILDQPLLFLSADHYLEQDSVFFSQIKKNIKKLNDENIFLFGAKPTFPSTEYGYFLTDKSKKKVITVKKFIEKPNQKSAKRIIKKGAYWNTGMFLLNSKSALNNFDKYSPKIYSLIIDIFSRKSKTKVRNNIYYLDKKIFKKIPSISFDYAILEKTKNINAIKLNIPWSDLGNWREILKIFNKKKLLYFNKKNLFHRPWGKYINLFRGKNFLIKELTINSKSSISLQKHYHRSEHWTVIQGKPRISLNKKKFYKRENESVYIPKGAIHRIENIYKKPVRIMEAQIGSNLKETDIVRYKDIYGRAN